MCEMRTSDKSVRPTLSLSLLCGDIYKICQLWNRGLMEAELRDISSVEISCLMWKSWKGSQNPDILQAYLVYVSLYVFQ